MTTATELETAKNKLIGLLSDTDTIYTVLRSVSKSGLSRSISFYVVDNNKEIVNINKTRDGLIVKGGGMDMGFHVVHTLLRELNAGLKIGHRWL